MPLFSFFFFSFLFFKHYLKNTFEVYKHNSIVSMFYNKFITGWLFHETPVEQQKFSLGAFLFLFVNDLLQCMVLTHISGLFTCCSHVLKLRRAIDRPTADHLTYRERTEKCMNPQDLVKRFLQVAVNCDAVHRAVLFSPCF